MGGGKRVEARHPHQSKSMSLLFLFLKATVYQNFQHDWPIFLILVDLDLLVLMRMVWTVRHWR